MSYTFFDPSNATDLAKFQGTLSGTLAGNASYVGVGCAPTSIYNQAGFYAVQDSDTGYVKLQKLHDDSLYTKQWYDQSLGTIFDFSEGGSGVTHVRDDGSNTATSNSTNSISGTYSNNYSNSTTTNSSTSNTTNSTSNSTTSNSTSSTSNSSGYVEYPWGSGYIAVDPNNGVSTSTTSTGEILVDEDGEPITLDAADLEELVDAGIYSSTQEALEATLADGYTVTDEEQAKLGIYSEEDESKIQLMMEKYGITRTEAIEKLGDTIGPKADSTEIEAMFNSLVDSGFSKEDAASYLEELGYDVPSELTEEQPVYSDADEQKIAALQQSTGCTREEAIDILGVKPDEPGLLRSIGNAIGGFVSGIAEGAANLWNSFVDFIW
ncbi:TPA: hypothetical protein IAA82_04760 [Candidatus Galligastranaerophilus gallistercoris]|nr:hypothetical protein [Candidatus Galligastranaerophilus gallistercoris]